ncbi:MAG: putative inner membrane protein [Wigglesworthia glossinidia]|nr:putative inner membrane protein [Wigglesworthia glossinidia]
MPIFIKNLLFDSWNFFINQILNITLFSIISAIISGLVSYIFFPTLDEISSLSHIVSNVNESINNMQYLFKNLSNDQKYILFKLSLSSHLSGLIGNAFLFSNIILMIYNICNKKNYTFYQLILNALSFFPKFLTLILLVSFLVQCGIAFMIIPGIFLLVIFSFSPILISNKNIGIIHAMRTSMHYAFSNIRSITPIIILWLILKLIILITVSQIFIYSSLISIKIFFYLINNIITSYIIIYIYRLFILSINQKIQIL